MNYYDQRSADAAAGLRELLARPMPDHVNLCVGEEGAFDPWDLFPSLYGSYDQAFDICAIAVLTEIRDGEKERDDLGAEMLREMLCVAGLCDYGTSPRVCFPTSEFRDLLPDLIDKWTVWSELSWSRP